MEETKALILKIDQIDADYVNKIGDEIFQHQPYLLSIMLGYRLDVKPMELEELMKVYFIIWEYFKDQNNVRKVKISEAHFERIQLRNIHFFKYLEGEQSEVEKKNIVANDIELLDSKNLLTAVFYWFKNRPVLTSMNKETLGIILVGLKSFIECFEEIVKEKVIE